MATKGTVAKEKVTKIIADAAFGGYDSLTSIEISTQITLIPKKM